jgi:hypothetical protein
MAAGRLVLGGEEMHCICMSVLNFGAAGTVFLHVVSELRSGAASLLFACVTGSCCIGRTAATRCILSCMCERMEMRWVDGTITAGALL